MISKEQIVDNFTGAIHCSQVVSGEMAEKLGVDKSMLMSATGALGGGCFRGDVCGCVSSSLVCIGLSCGHCHKGDMEANQRLVEKTTEFEKRFTEKHGSICCRDLTGYDFSVPGELEKAMADGILFKKCPVYVQSALEILDDLI